MDKAILEKLNAYMSENKGTRKFTQSVDVAVNFSGIDFTKQANRLNMEVVLPNAFGKATKIIVFAEDKNIVAKAQQLGAKIIAGAELATIAADKAMLNELLDASLIAQPSLMPQIARALGQFLGPRNKMPKPLVGNADINTLAQSAGNTIALRSKGKYLPTLHCSIANESMGAEQIAANIDEVVNTLAKKVGRQNIKSVYVKLTMSKPLRII